MHALRVYRALLARTRTSPVEVSLDGVAWRENLLFVEVLNISAVGPNLELSPASDPGDRFLEVVTAGEAQRRALDDYLASRLLGSARPPMLPVRRARQVRIDGPGEVHIDGEVRDRPGTPVEIDVECRAVTFLAAESGLVPDGQEVTPGYWRTV